MGKRITHSFLFAGLLLKILYHNLEDLARNFSIAFGNGKIHHCPLGEGEEGRPHPESFRDGVRKILITSTGIFKEIRKESSCFKRLFAGLVPRERKPRKKQIDDEILAIQTNETAYYEQYEPVSVWPERDSLSNKWQRVKEWDEYINDPMDKMVIEKGT